MKASTALNTVVCPEPTREEIAMCAFLAWEKEGRQFGRDFDYWVQAETQLRAAHRQKLEAAAAQAALPWPRPSRAAVKPAAARSAREVKQTVTPTKKRSVRPVRTSALAT